MNKTRVCRLAIRANQSIDVFDLKEILDLVPDDTKIWGFDRSLSENASIILLENEAFKEVERCSIVPKVNVFEDEDGSFTADFSEVLEEQPEKLRRLDSLWVDEAARVTIERMQKDYEMYRSIQPENPGQMIVASTPTGTSRWMEEFYRETVVPKMEPTSWDSHEDHWVIVREYWHKGKLPEIKIDESMEDGDWAIKNADGTRWVDDFEYFTGTEPETKHFIESGKIEPRKGYSKFPEGVCPIEYTGPEPKFLPEEECQHEWKSYMGLSEQFSYCIHCDEKRK